MKQVIYKQKDGTVNNFNPEVIPSTFNGYKITKYYSKPNTVILYESGVEVGNIKLRPTSTPIIWYAQLGSYCEERYSNDKVSTVHYVDNKGIQGQHIRYDIDGNISLIQYYQNSVDITDDVVNFVGYKGDRDSFKNYKFREEEVFNIYMLYGSKFKFYNEYRIESKTFDDILKFCLK